MTDRISLLGVRARGFHGVLADEKRDGQDFVVDVVLHLDLAPAGARDDLERTVKTLVARSCSEVAPDGLRQRVMLSIKHVQVQITETER